MIKVVPEERRIDYYLAAVIIPSIILAAVALWALIRQYNVIDYHIRTQAAAVAGGEMFGAFSRVSIFAFGMIIFALLMILIIGSYLSAQNMQRQFEVAKLKNDFVSTVSHELKTPLTSIRLLTERSLKLQPNQQDKRKEYLELILAQSYQLSHLIGNILDFSKLEQEGKEMYKFERTNLAEIVRQSISDYPAGLIRPDCKLETANVAAELPATLLDKEAISRAFVNLLDNALKFSPSFSKVRINTGKNAQEVFFEIVDRGPGLDAQEKKKVFQRFYHQGKGTGLGLALVKKIVEGHQGRIELESQKGKGSTFRVVLPIKLG
ncbi:sensor histidine kinase [Candidatus Omnitrophota bacterium]